MAVAHDGAGSGAHLRRLARTEVTRWRATIAWFWAEIVRVRGADVVPDFMAGHHDVPVLRIVVNQRIRERAGKIARHGITPRCVARNAQPCNTAAEAAC